MLLIDECGPYDPYDHVIARRMEATEAERQRAILRFRQMSKGICREYFRMTRLPTDECQCEGCR